MTLSVKLTKSGNELRCFLDGAPTASTQVTWVLHRGDLDPRRAGRPVNTGTNVTFNLPDVTTCFLVRAHMNNGAIVDSRWVQHFSDDVRSRYAAWLEECHAHSPVPPPPIPLFKYEEPYENFALILHSGSVCNKDIERAASERGLSACTYRGVYYDHIVALSTSSPDVDCEGTRFIFSGVTRDSSSLLFGASDVRARVADIASLRDQVGEFHLASWNANEVYVGKDYIGLGHIFYFERDDIVVVANGLHLLVLLLKAMKLPVRLNAKVAKSKFYATSYAAESHVGLDTDFDEVRRLSVFESLLVDSEGVHLTDNELSRDSADGDLDDETYETLLYRAKDEIVDNVRIALEHSRFSNVVFELSAGLDSRINYAALTNLPPSTKTRIRTKDGREKRTAASINNLYLFPWDDLAKTHQHEVMSTEDRLPATSHSVFMDGYYIEAMHKPRAQYGKDVLLITGHCGEAYSRAMSVEGFFAYPSRGALPSAVRTRDEMWSHLFRSIGGHTVWFEAGERYLRPILERTLDRSRTAVFEKGLHQLYVSERNPFVGGSVFRGAMSAPQWRPLQSKSLYRLKALWFVRAQDYRLQFDLIRVLNPLISEVPYMEPIERVRLEEFKTYRPGPQLVRDIEFDESLEDFERAQHRAQSRSTWLPTREVYEQWANRVLECEDSADSFLVPLWHLISNHSEFEDMGLPLFSYILKAVHRKSPRSFSKRHNIRNKLHILMQESLLADR